MIETKEETKVLVLVFDRGTLEDAGRYEEPYLVSFDSPERAEAFRRIFNTASTHHTNIVGGYPGWAAIVNPDEVANGEREAKEWAEHMADILDGGAPQAPYEDWVEVADRCPKWNADDPADPFSV